jgi:hypothetical protein
VARILWWWGGRVLVIVGAIAIPFGAALPWYRIGSVRRSAFSLARHASELGLIETTGARAAVVALFLSPAVLGVVVIVVAMGWRRTLGVLAGFLGLAAWLTGIVGLRFDSVTKQGPLVTSLGGSCCLIGALAVLTAPERQDSSPHAVPADEHHEHDLLHGAPRTDTLEHPPTSKDHE